jgi:hypothetical protein
LPLPPFGEGRIAEGGIASKGIAMKMFFIFGCGFLIGYIAAERGSFYGGKDAPVSLNGGVISSSTVGTIYGYADDFEGCNIHAKAMNYYFKSGNNIREKILASNGNSFCSYEPIR